MRRIYATIFAMTVFLLIHSGCAPVSRGLKGTIDVSGQAAKPVETISKPCIPDEPERIVVIKGIVADIPIDEEIRLPPGPLKLCEGSNGQTSGEGGGMASSSWTHSGDTGWGNGSISGEYFNDSDGKIRIRIKITLYSAPSEPAGIKKEYHLLASEIPNTFIDGNSKISLSLGKHVGIQNDSR